MLPKRRSKDEEDVPVFHQIPGNFPITPPCSRVDGLSLRFYRSAADFGSWTTGKNYDIIGELRRERSFEWKCSLLARPRGFIFLCAQCCTWPYIFLFVVQIKICTLSCTNKIKYNRAEVQVKIWIRICLSIFDFRYNQVQPKTGNYAIYIFLSITRKSS